MEPNTISDLRCDTEPGDRCHELTMEIQKLTRRTKTVLALAAALAWLPAQAQAAPDRPELWHYGQDWGWGHMIFGSVMMLLVWGAIIVGIVMLVRWLSGGQSPVPTSAPARNRALEILQERFARGDIDEAEFEKRKRLLSD